jgi:hypothetical protein
MEMAVRHSLISGHGSIGGYSVGQVCNLPGKESDGRLQTCPTLPVTSTPEFLNQAANFRCRALAQRLQLANGDRMQVAKAQRLDKLPDSRLSDEERKNQWPLQGTCH